MTKEFQIGDWVFVISNSVWKWRRGVIQSKVENTETLYRVAGLEGFLIAFDACELILTHPK